MKLNKIVTKSSLTVLGLNSGTSADGLDMAVVRLQRTRGRLKIDHLGGRGRAYPQKLKEMVLKVADGPSSGLEDVIRLDIVLGQFYGRQAADFIKTISRRGIAIDVVASHGQTVRHLPQGIEIGRCRMSGTLQLGSLSHIACLTGKITVGDFRQAEVALGLEGAPITVGAMARLFADPGEPRLIVNIGGMSNYFYFPAAGSRLKTAAADCGPGNSLSDILAGRLFGKKLDLNGRRAASGTVSRRLLSLLLGSEFYRGGTISTGRESFGPQTADKMIDFGRRFGLSSDDLMATAAELTTTSIVAKVRPLVKADKRLTRLYLTGGGRKNIFFCKRLGQHLPDLAILKIDELGVDGDLVEAAAYALMGEAALRSEPLGCDSVKVSGRGARAVLGVIVQPPGFRARSKEL